MHLSYLKDLKFLLEKAKRNAIQEAMKLSDEQMAKILSWLAADSLEELSVFYVKQVNKDLFDVYQKLSWFLGRPHLSFVPRSAGLI